MLGSSRDDDVVREAEKATGDRCAYALACTRDNEDFGRHCRFSLTGSMRMRRCLVMKFPCVRSVFQKVGDLKLCDLLPTLAIHGEAAESSGS